MQTIHNRPRRKEPEAAPLKPLALGVLRFGLTCVLLAALAALAVACLDPTLRGWHLWNGMANTALRFLVFTAIAVIITDQPGETDPD